MIFLQLAKAEGIIMSFSLGLGNLLVLYNYNIIIIIYYTL